MDHNRRQVVLTVVSGMLVNPSPVIELSLQDATNSKPNCWFEFLNVHDTYRRKTVFWTIFTVVILFWIIGLGAAFGPGVMPLLLVLIMILGLMNFAFRRTSLN